MAIEPEEVPGAHGGVEPPAAGWLARWWNERHWQRRGIITVLVAAIALGGYFGAKRGLGWMRARQVDRHLIEAQEAAAAKDWPRARNLARSVLQARPGEFIAFRIWQRSLAYTDDPRSYMASISLFYDPQATLEDRMESFRALALQAPQALALASYSHLTPEERERPETAAALAEILLLRGQYSLLEETLRQQPGIATHPGAQLALLKTLCASEQGPEKIAEARTIFFKLIEIGASQEALAALVVLGATEGGLEPAPELENLSEWVDHQPLARTEHRLLALDPALAADPANKQKILTRAVDQFLAQAPGELGNWLVGHGQYELAANALEPFAGSDAGAFKARIHAMLAADRSEDAAKLLTSPPPAMDGLEIEFLDVDLARQAGDQAGEERAWTRALQQAPLDTSRNRFLEIANRAEQLGNQRVAERAWVAAIRVGSGRLPLYRDLMPLIASLSAQSRSADLLELFRILLRFEPQNLELQNNYLYLALIHGLTPPQEALAKFELLAKDNPDMPALASGAALAALMTGEPAKALASLQYISSTPESSMMRFALLGTATLLNGDADGARPLLAKVNWNRFLNQEILIFRKLQVDSQVANLPLPELRIPPGDDSSIEWQSAQQRLERANELLPPLPPLHIPGSAAPDPAASEPQAPPR